MAAAPISYGYPKASIEANKLPVWQQPLARFTVDGPNDWKVNPLPSIDRGIRVEAGMGSGDAVTDVTTPYDTMALPYPNIASRWYLIVRRRNWSGIGTTTLVAIPGSAEKKLPARSDAPGDESDQPLALVLVTQKDSTVQEIVDLRCWASNGGVEVADKLALEYLGTPGAAVKLGGVVLRFERQANGVWGWNDRPGQTAKQAITLTGLYSPDPPREDKLPQEAPSAYKDGDRVHLSGVASNAVEVLFAGGTEYGLGSVPPGMSPAKVEYFTLESGFTMCRVWVRPDGEIRFMFALKFGPLPARQWKFSLSAISYQAAPSPRT